jgi:hypothetical protein
MAEFRRAGAEAIKTEGTMMFFLNMDRSFEGGLWANFPPIPVSLSSCPCVGSLSVAGG